MTLYMMSFLIYLERQKIYVTKESHENFLSDPQEERPEKVDTIWILLSLG